MLVRVLTGGSPPPDTEICWEQGRRGAVRAPSPSGASSAEPPPQRGEPAIPLGLHTLAAHLNFVLILSKTALGKTWLALASSSTGAWQRNRAHPKPLLFCTPSPSSSPRGQLKALDTH